MFGYIRPFQPEMKICEYDAYKALYCGLCKQLGRSFGPLARLTLNYDFTFLAAVAMAVDGQKPQMSPGRCALNPFKKSMCCGQNPQLELSADIALIMLYHKLRDNLADEGLGKKLLARLGLGLWGGACRKAMARRPAAAKAMADAMEGQAALEAARCADVDQAAEPTARALSGVFATLTEDKADRRVLERLGYLVGRYVYLIDALDDLESDLKSGGYNPFALRHQLSADRPQEMEAVRQGAKGSLYLTIAEAGKAYELLTVRRFGPILENILFLGLKYSVDTILNKDQCSGEGGQAVERSV